MEKTSSESATASNETRIEEKNSPDSAGQHAEYGKLLDLHGNEFILPDYTIKQIYDAIPPECFERKVLKSLRYVVQDLSLIILTFLVFNKYVNPTYIPSYPLRFVLWSWYTFIQGLFGSGIWVLAHECGHMAFSTSKTFNDSLGWLLHSALLVPYFSWKITHRNHHKGIANMATDTSIRPRHTFRVRSALWQDHGKHCGICRRYTDIQFYISAVPSTFRLADLHADHDWRWRALV